MFTDGTAHSPILPLQFVGRMKPAGRLLALLNSMLCTTRVVGYPLPSTLILPFLLFIFKADHRLGPSMQEI